MLNNAVTLYLLVFLFVRRRDDIVAGEDEDSEKEDIADWGTRECVGLKGVILGPDEGDLLLEFLWDGDGDGDQSDTSAE